MNYSKPKNRNEPPAATLKPTASEQQEWTRRRPDRPEWIRSKHIGSCGEEIAAAFFQFLGLNVQQQIGHADCDLRISGDVEVKADHRSIATNNIAIEVSYRGQPGGIRASTASTWIYVVGDELLVMSASRLRDLISAKRYPLVKCGDHAECLLVPLADIRGVSLVVSRAQIGGAK
jgi:hypothetical protein